MTFVKGNPGGPGRPKGSVDKKQQALRDGLIHSGLTPLEFFKQIYEDGNMCLEDRLEAAKAAAPYLHMKMPTKLDVSGEIGVIPPTLPRRMTADESTSTDS